MLWVTPGRSLFISLCVRDNWSAGAVECWESNEQRASAWIVILQDTFFLNPDPCPLYADFVYCGLPNLRGCGILKSKKLSSDWF
jgi:hypothetical protein